MAAGSYPDRFDLFRSEPAEPDTFGQKARSRPRELGDYPKVATLWGALVDVTASRTSEKGSDRQETQATIRLRNYPDVYPDDRLRDTWGRIWTVVTVVAGDNEVVCDVTA